MSTRYKIKLAEKLIEHKILEGKIFKEEVDTSDYLDTLKKQGFTDEEKLKGMDKRAKELAKDPNDKAEVLGILQTMVKPEKKE